MKGIWGSCFTGSLDYGEGAPGAVGIWNCGALQGLWLPREMVQHTHMPRIPSPWPYVLDTIESALWWLLPSKLTESSRTWLFELSPECTYLMSAPGLHTRLCPASTLLGLGIWETSQGHWHLIMPPANSHGYLAYGLSM